MLICQPAMLCRHLKQDRPPSDEERDFRLIHMDSIPAADLDGPNSDPQPLNLVLHSRNRKDPNTDNPRTQDNVCPDKDKCLSEYTSRKYNKEESYEKRARSLFEQSEFVYGSRGTTPPRKHDHNPWSPDEMSAAIKDYFSGHQVPARDVDKPGNILHDRVCKSGMASTLHNWYSAHCGYPAQKVPQGVSLDSEHYSYPSTMVHKIVSPSSEHYSCPVREASPVSVHSSHSDNTIRVEGWLAKAVFSPVSAFISRPEELIPGDYHHRIAKEADDERWSSRHSHRERACSSASPTSCRHWSAESNINHCDRNTESWSAGSNVEDSVRSRRVVSPENMTEPLCTSHPYWRNEAHCGSRASHVRHFIHERDQRNGNARSGCTSRAHKKLKGSHTRAERNNKKMHNRYKDKNSYCAEIAAILIRSGNLPLAEIYDMYEAAGLDQKRPSTHSWKNSIRHNLSLHDCFIKIPSVGHGFNRWAVHPKWVQHFKDLGQEAGGKSSSQGPSPPSPPGLIGDEPGEKSPAEEEVAMEEADNNFTVEIKQEPEDEVQ